MDGEWGTTPLGDLLQDGRRISYGIVQPGVPDDRGTPILRVSDIRGGRINTSSPLRVAPQIEAQYERTRLRGGELLLTLVGTVGEAAVVPYDLAGWNLARAVALVPVRQDIGADWIMAVLQTPQLRHRIFARVNTTVQTTLNLADVVQLPIPLPAPSIRAAITNILRALDDKIELNRRMTATLEATARALFHSWFVDFDPVHARAEGRTTGLADNFASLFPKSFSENGVPEGWVIQTVGDMYEVIGGNTPSTEREEFWGGAHLWASPKDLSSLDAPVLVRTGRQLTDAGLAQTSSGLLPARSLLLSSRAPIGYMAFSTVPTAVNQGFAGIVRKQVSTCYAWAWCHSYMGMIKGNAGGSTFPEISKSVFRRLPMLSPSSSVLEAFSDIADCLVDRLVAAVQQQGVLADLRDTLLPKLISGELQISVAERSVAAA